MGQRQTKAQAESRARIPATPTRPSTSSSCDRASCTFIPVTVSAIRNDGDERRCRRARPSSPLRRRLQHQQRAEKPDDSRRNASRADVSFRTNAASGTSQSVRVNDSAFASASGISDMHKKPGSCRPCPRVRETTECRGASYETPHVADAQDDRQQHDQSCKLAIESLQRRRIVLAQHT